MTATSRIATGRELIEHLDAYRRQSSLALHLRAAAGDYLARADKADRSADAALDPARPILDRSNYLPGEPITEEEAARIVARWNERREAVEAAAADPEPPATYGRADDSRPFLCFGCGNGKPAGAIRYQHDGGLHCYSCEHAYGAYTCDECGRFRRFASPRRKTDDGRVLCDWCFGLSGAAAAFEPASDPFAL